MTDAPKVADAGEMIPELKPCSFCGSTRIALMNWHDFDRETYESNGVKHFAKCAGCWARIDDQHSKHDAIEKWNTRAESALEAENRRVREALSDSATVHVNILRGTIALTKAQAIHIAGLPADIEQKVAQLKEQVRKLSAPVSDEADWYLVSSGSDGAMCLLVQWQDLRAAIHEAFCCCKNLNCDGGGYLDDWDDYCEEQQREGAHWDLEDGWVKVEPLKARPTFFLAIRTQEPAQTEGK